MHIEQQKSQKCQRSEKHVAQTKLWCSIILKRLTHTEHHKLARNRWFNDFSSNNRNENTRTISYKLVLRSCPFMETLGFLTLAASAPGVVNCWSWKRSSSPLRAATATTVSVYELCLNQFEMLPLLNFTSLKNNNYIFKKNLKPEQAPEPTKIIRLSNTGFNK